ncbi:MAG: electron transport complex subunit E [Cycloclasticus sp.]|nr:electron transport complex subunit E [Cycloclasticus sp.]
MNDYKQIIKNGLWENNQAFVALLGLCPLLAVSNTFINGLGLGLATTLTLILSNTTISLIRHQVGSEVRLPVFVLIIASIVTAIELAMNAFFYELYLILGIFIPLIVTNCAIIGRAEAFASKNPLLASFFDGLGMGLGFTFALVSLGALREVLGSGTLFANAHLMFGEAAKNITLTVIPNYEGFLLAILPPGAFIGLGLMVAVKNIIDARRSKPNSQVISLSEVPKKA